MGLTREKGAMPENLNYESKDEYDSLTGSESLFQSKKNTEDLFILAMAIGYRMKTKKKLKKKLPNIRLRTRGDQFFWKIRPLSIVRENSLDPLLDESGIYSEAEEYSNAGIKELMRIIFGKGNKKSDSRFKLLELIDELAEK